MNPVYDIYILHARDYLKVGAPDYRPAVDEHREESQTTLCRFLR
jgi:hypothetical protein